MGEDRGLFGEDRNKRTQQIKADQDISDNYRSELIEKEAEQGARRREDHDKAMAKAMKEDMKRVGGLPSEIEAYNDKKNKFDKVDAEHKTTSEKLRVTNDKNTKINDEMENLLKVINPHVESNLSDTEFADASREHAIEISKIDNLILPKVQVTANLMKIIAQKIKNLRDEEAAVFPGQIIKLFIPKYYENEISKKSSKMKEHRDFIVTAVKKGKETWDKRDKSKEELHVEGLKQKLDNLSKEVEEHHSKIKPIVGLLRPVRNVSGYQWKDEETKNKYKGVSLGDIIKAENEKGIVNPEELSVGCKEKNPNLQKMGEKAQTATDNVQQARQEMSAKEINQWANITDNNTENTRPGRG